jgi:hypothetical protein
MDLSFQAVRGRSILSGAGIHWGGVRCCAAGILNRKGFGKMEKKKG